MKLTLSDLRSYFGFATQTELVVNDLTSLNKLKSKIVYIGYCGNIPTEYFNCAVFRCYVTNNILVVEVWA